MSKGCSRDSWTMIGSILLFLSKVEGELGKVVLIGLVVNGRTDQEKIDLRIVKDRRREVGLDRYLEAGLDQVGEIESQGIKKTVL